MCGPLASAFKGPTVVALELTNLVAWSVNLVFLLIELFAASSWSAVILDISFALGVVMSLVLLILYAIALSGFGKTSPAKQNLIIGVAMAAANFAIAWVTGFAFGYAVVANIAFSVTGLIMAHRIRVQLLGQPAGAGILA